MGQELAKIKTRIRSVSGALKVTSAMKLVSTVKLQKWKGKMLANKAYSEEMKSVAMDVLGYAESATSFSTPHCSTGKKLFIIVSSTLGLCGSYNNNIFKVSESAISKDDDAIILGNKGIIHFKDGEFTSLPGFEGYTNVDNQGMVRQLGEYVLNHFSDGTYAEVHMIYSEYKNSIVFLAKDETLLPLKKEESKKGIAPIMEPDAASLTEAIVPLYIKTVLFSHLLESEVCEQAARCNAMDNATENAKDLLSDLKLEFNKARQASITQEITEIVGASKAL